MFKGRHFDRSVILLCVRWYLAYNLSLRDLEEMMAERGLSIDHSTVHRWVGHFSPQLLECFQQRKRAVAGKWHIDETYIKALASARGILDGIEMVHMMRKRQARFAHNPHPSIADQFEILAA